MSPKPRVWALLGAHTGDNNQVLALARALGVPFERVELRYNLLRKLGPRLLGTSLAAVTADSRQLLRPPWPDLVVGIGRRSVPVARWLKQQSGGHTKIVRLGDPRHDPALFDLVLTTPQYRVPEAPNVVQLPLALSPYQELAVAEPDEAAWLQACDPPHLLLAIGGETRNWRLSKEVVSKAARRLIERAGQGCLTIVTSARTSPDLRHALRSLCTEHPRCRLVAGPRPRFAVLLADADECFVTADSVSMLSEAVLAGKPVGMVPVELTAAGRRRLGERSGEGHRDLRRFWERLERDGLVGTVDAPRRGRVENPIETAVRAVRELLERS
ncbi:mitochondrial fission ELM1 family protein [Sphingomonas sp. BN140010]|uniref:Mitochondrial fission ELM1 family protein n=1 Tax=Sphingomonas arvum TaxID=2992113 RepID=A0ABT3JHS5_9SPHN|nr:mitochondrial fission ELM1 family protein [Sphingomonas sp. BN140010]MCW3798499.1 mitochondrial fission ELM1 family protein [Sphingomonas sp. BN140010]